MLYLSKGYEDSCFQIIIFMLFYGCWRFSKTVGTHFWFISHVDMRIFEFANTKIHGSDLHNPSAIDLPRVFYCNLTGFETTQRRSVRVTYPIGTSENRTHRGGFDRCRRRRHCRRRLYRPMTQDKSATSIVPLCNLLS